MSNITIVARIPLLHVRQACAYCAGHDGLRPFSHSRFTQGMLGWLPEYRRYAFAKEVFLGVNVRLTPPPSVVRRPEPTHSYTKGKACRAQLQRMFCRASGRVFRLFFGELTGGRFFYLRRSSTADKSGVSD
jgi:hypothetical protein